MSINVKINQFKLLDPQFSVFQKFIKRVQVSDSPSNKMRSRMSEKVGKGMEGVRTWIGIPSLVNNAMAIRVIKPIVVKPKNFTFGKHKLRSNKKHRIMIRKNSRQIIINIRTKMGGPEGISQVPVQSSPSSAKARLTVAPGIHHPTKPRSKSKLREIKFENHLAFLE